jgi:ABC-type microcin C transport system duplicated ATPase subunit YejF
VLTCGYQVTEAIQLHLGSTEAEAKAQTIKLFNEVQLPRPEAIFDSYPHQYRRAKAARYDSHGAILRPGDIDCR